MRVARLGANLEAMHAGLVEAGWKLAAPVSPIVPLHVGDEGDAVRLSEALRGEGLLVPAIRYPTVPRGRARLRVTLSAAHDAEDIAAFQRGLARALNRTGLAPG